jgi:hypothetical protein
MTSIAFAVLFDGWSSRGLGTIRFIKATNRPHHWAESGTRTRRQDPRLVLSERCSVATRATLRWPFCFSTVWKEPSDCHRRLSGGPSTCEGSHQGFGMDSPRATKQFSHRQPRSVSRSSSQKCSASSGSASPSGQDLRHAIRQNRSAANDGARPVRAMSEKPSHQSFFNSTEHPDHAETVDSKPRAQRSHSSPPKPKSVQFAEGTKGSPRQTSMSPPPLVRTKAQARTKPSAREETGALGDPRRSPLDKPVRSLSISPRKTKQKRLLTQLEEATTTIAMLEKANANFLARIRHQEVQIGFLNEKNTSLLEANISLSEEIHRLSVENTFLTEEKQ